MPYVSESSSDPNRLITVGRNKTVSFASHPNGRRRSQYGFRTRHLTPEEVASIEAGTSNSATMLSHIRLLEETSGGLESIGYQQHDMRYWPTNRRDYRETAYYPTGFIAQLDIRPHPHKVPNKVTLQGAHGIVSAALALPGDPATWAAQNMAASLLRESRPPVERFNIARSLAEQKDAGLLMKMENYFPRSPRQLGGAILNFLFGLKPTGEDLGKAMSIALRTSPAILELIALEKVQERRYNVKETFNQSDSGIVKGNFDSCKAGGSTFNVGPIRIRGDYLTYNGTTGSLGNVMDSMFTWSYSMTQRIRTFATWEYFIPRPLGLEERLPAYESAAKQLLQTFRFDESVVYDLTPWTWLGNWLFDIGGVLRYQRAVIDNQQVMSNSGYSITTELVANVTYDGQTPNTNHGQGSYYEMTSLNHPASTCAFREKRVIREPCTPYSVGPTWVFNPQQWAILGALGLSRSPGIPNIR